MLPTLQEGLTSKEELMRKLGEPARAFQRDTILIYRFSKEGGAGAYSLMDSGVAAGKKGWPIVNPCECSLVLVFDDQGVLRKHSLVELMKDAP